MFRWASPLRRSPELRRRLALTLATAENLIIQANVEEAVSFLQATEDELAFEDALAIYFRVAGVPARIRQAVTISALSRLGKESSLEELLEDVPPDEGRGVMGLARRLRGRRREALRQEVEHASARARARVRSSYLDGAANAVESLREIVPPTEAVQHFIDALQLGPGWAEFVFHEVVRREWADAAGGTEPSGSAEPGAIDDAEARLETPDADT
jgi:hypothetical protein